jgi:hypothetical protein
MALYPKRFSAAQRAARLFYVVELRRHAGSHPSSCAVRRCREKVEREVSPVACIIDSQSVKSAEKRALYRSAGVRCGQADQGQETTYSRRHTSLLLHTIVHSAGVQDRDGGIWLLATLFGQFPFLAKLFANSAYEGPIFNTALARILPNLKTEILKRSDHPKGFVPLPKRWIVERCSATIWMRGRRQSGWRFGVAAI